MAPERDRWNSGWDYSSGKPIAVEGGIATRKKRGAMADTWWSSRLVDLLASYGLGGRMERGRNYARRGQLASLDVERGVVRAVVQGSRATPYDVIVRFTPLTGAQWDAVQHEIESTLRIAAALLAGEVPPELEQVFGDAGVALLPARWSDLDASCSCPDFGNPCKHIAATLYVLADRLDDDPWLLLTWRGRTREALLAHLGTNARRDEVAPWWPLVPGAPKPVDDGRGDPLDAVDPRGALTRLGPLAVTVRGTPVDEIVGAAYDALAAER